MVSKGNHPQMAELFRVVKYDNLPRYDDMDVYEIYLVELELSKKSYGKSP